MLKFFRIYSLTENLYHKKVYICFVFPVPCAYCYLKPYKMPNRHVGAVSAFTKD